MKQMLKPLITGVAVVAATALPVNADVIFKGTRGPTEWQLDERVSFSRNEKGVETLVDNMIIKHWDGKKAGTFFFAAVPYKHVDTSQSAATGIGDVTIGFGPRGTVGNIHFLTYGGVTLPTGDAAAKPALGNGRTDFKTGAYVTYLTPDKKFEIDGSLEYTLTGGMNTGLNPPNELAAGFVLGGQVGHFRIAAGLTGFKKDNGDYLLNDRGIVRYVVSPKLHFEVICDKTVAHQNLPSATTVTGIVRYNFGKE